MSATPVEIGLTLSGEEHGPNALVDLAVQAEARGFDFVSLSDHYHPWVDEQGHAPFVWAVLGGVARATESIGVGVGVSCPIQRIHPAIVAQAAATAACMLEGRFTFGVGSGEALNEHITGERWPTGGVRLEMLDESIDVMRRLWDGGNVTHRGTHYTVENAQLYDLPDTPFPLLVSAFGEKAGELAARQGDGLWVTGTGGPGLDNWRDAGGEGQIWTQLTFCYDPDEEAARERAARVWPNTAVVGQLSQDLPTTEHFAMATAHVTPETIGDEMPCGPDPGPIVEAFREAVDAGIDHVYLHQVGHDLDPFLDWWDAELGPALREAAGT